MLAYNADKTILSKQNLKIQKRSCLIDIAIYIVYSRRWPPQQGLEIQVNQNKQIVEEVKLVQRLRLAASADSHCELQQPETFRGRISDARRATLIHRQAFEPIER